MPAADVTQAELIPGGGSHARVRVRFPGASSGPPTPALLLRDAEGTVRELYALGGRREPGAVTFDVPPELIPGLAHELVLRVDGETLTVEAPPEPVPAPASAPAERPAGGGPLVLVVDDDELIRDLVALALEDHGLEVVTAEDGRQGLEQARLAPPDLIVSDVMMPDLDGLGLVEALREDPRTEAIPLIFLTSLGTPADVVRGLQLGADDYLPKPFELPELVARVDAKLARRPVPVAQLPTDPRTGLLTPQRFLAEAGRELDRAARSGRPGVMAAVDLPQLEGLRDRYGTRAEGELATAVTAMLLEEAGPLDVAGRDGAGRFLLLVPETGVEAARDRLQRVAERIAQRPLTAAGERVRLSPSTGLAVLEPGVGPQELVDRARVALGHASSHLDLRPQLWEPAMGTAPKAKPQRPLLERLRLPFQIFVTQVVATVVPFLVYLWLYESAGIDVAPVLYLIIVFALLMTATLIWLEGLRALRGSEPPREPGAPEPPASAIIAAYLPNEAATVMETIEAFLRLEYAGPLQIVLAYNTPEDMPIEAELRDLAERDPRFVPFRVEGSTSKAQNVNAALPMVTGEFVGVFDADHQPMPDAYARAWRWLSNGYDVVQGHCLVRNGDASWVARMVAVEFEMIYGVSHPGRASMHGFGIFGGSNGYWRTDLLAKIRMRGSMLTEDIDSSLRVVEGGGRIASDPGLISRELGPATLKALWNQRMRWAQGWFQVSRRHFWEGLRSEHLTLRNKVGLAYLLGWREVYPWISLQMFPLIAFMAVREGGVDQLDFFVPIFVLTTLFTVSTGPWQTLFAWRLAAKEIRERGRWFLFYLVVSSVFYTEFKNVIGRVAQLKELMGERAWKVTPREASS